MVKSALLILATLSIPQVTPKHPERKIVDTRLETKTKGGRWYMADDGHAVYCYGPEMMVPNSSGGIDKVATFCRGDRTIVKERE